MKYASIALASIAAMAYALNGNAQPAEGNGCKEVPGKICVCGEGKSCACETADELTNPEAVLMDGTMLRALLAAVEFRATTQRQSLRPSELDLSNFRIGVSRRPARDVADAYAVSFRVKSAPGEPGPSLTGTSLGFSYTYFVDKRTFRVVKHQRQE